MAFLRLVWGNKPRYSGYAVHLGIILMVVGVVGCILFKAEREVNSKAGRTMTIDGHSLTYKGLTEYATLSKWIASATLTVSNKGKHLGQMVSEKYLHRSYEGPLSEVAIRSMPTEDLYILAGWGD